MSTRLPYLSESQLRSLSHQQLLQYTLNHIPTTNPNPSHPKRLPDSSPPHSPTDGPTRRRKKKLRKEFDMSRYGRRLVALHLVYTGWDFHGFSIQADNENTVEHHLFTALTKTRLIESRTTCQYSRSGRTDVGVSALGQVIGINLRSNLVPPSGGEKELDYVKIINGNLPQGIRVLAWSPVLDGSAPVPKTYPGDPPAVVTYWNAIKEGSIQTNHRQVRRPGEAFSARFDAIHRSYKYFFLRGGLDVMAMKTAAKHFEGTHDFRNFCRIDENVNNFERHMYTVDIHAMSSNHSISASDAESLGENDICYIFVKGQAFLWHQVRCMAAVLFDIGMRREHPSLVKQMLDDAKLGTGAFANGKPQYRMASPIPLLLYECAYPKSVVAFPQTFQASEVSNKTQKGCIELIHKTSFERADASLTQSYASVAIKATVLQAMLRQNDSLKIVTGDFLDANEQRVSFGSCRPPRLFLMDLNVGSHIPYSQRHCDHSLLVKKERAERKKESKHVKK